MINDGIISSSSEKSARICLNVAVQAKGVISRVFVRGDGVDRNTSHLKVILEICNGKYT